jgi:hypothetical protein
VLTHKQRIAYAIYAAEQVLEIFEKHNKEDKRPRITIDAARAVLKRDTQKNREAAAAAFDYAFDSAKAAEIAAAERASYAAAAVYHAAFAAAYGYVYSAAAAERAAYSAAVAAYDKKMQSRILAFGLKLLRKRKTMNGRKRKATGNRDK